MSGSEVNVLKAIKGTSSKKEINETLQELYFKTKQLEELKSEVFKNLETDIKKLKEKVRVYIESNGIVDNSYGDVILSPDKAVAVKFFFKGGKTELDPQAIKVYSPALYEELTSKEKYLKTTKRSLVIDKVDKATTEMIANSKK